MKRKIDYESNRMLGGKSKRYGPGYVYLIRQKGTNNCKIGISINPESRFIQIDYSVPFEIEMVHMILVPRMKETEDLWHRIFKEYRFKGEWFHLTSDAIRLFCSCGGHHEHGIEQEIFFENRWYWEK